MRTTPVMPTATPIAVPDALGRAMDAALQRGASEAQAWASVHPTGSASRFDRDVLAAMAPPPTGEVQRADLQQLHDVAATRTPEGIEYAVRFAKETGAREWGAELDMLAASHGADQAKAAQQMMQAAIDRTAAISRIAKVDFGRDRPFVTDPTLSIVVPGTGDNPSYPSGHSTAAFTAALVLAEWSPERRDQILDTAKTLAFARVYGGVHYPSDVVAAAALAGRVVSDIMRRDPVA